jgi:hypothetical protein
MDCLLLSSVGYLQVLSHHQIELGLLRLVERRFILSYGLEVYQCD